MSSGYLSAEGFEQRDSLVNLPYFGGRTYHDPSNLRLFRFTHYTTYLR